LKADITRGSFDPIKHFSRVVMQQGRVQLDADWNEQGAILLRYLRALAADLGGPSWGSGFWILTHGQLLDDFLIGPGYFYVDGILCELNSTPLVITSFPQSNSSNQIQVEAWAVDGVSFQKNQYLEIFDAHNPSMTPQTVKITDVSYGNLTLTLDSNVSAFNQPSIEPRVRRMISYLTQPDFPLPKTPGAFGYQTPQPLTAGSYHVYLDVWERLITYVDDDAIREVALNGPDTAARAKVIAQVKVVPRDTCLTARELSDMFQPWNRGRLRARVPPTQASTDPCTIAPTSGYRGPENQLYRVEINTGSIGAHGIQTAPSFKWSRENGCVIFPILSGGGTGTVSLENLGRDDRFSLSPGDFVEVQDDDYVLYNRAGILHRVESIDRTAMTVILSGNPDPTVGGDPAKHPLLRRWDHKVGGPEDNVVLGNDNAVPIPDAKARAERVWIDLEDGVQIQFVGDENMQFRPGDYWLIPARVATGDVIWPTEVVTDLQGRTTTHPAALPPDGVEHHYAPLAMVHVTLSGVTATPCSALTSPLVIGDPNRRAVRSART
jgi:hypothetical protein